MAYITPSIHILKVLQNSIFFATVGRYSYQITYRLKCVLILNIDKAVESLFLNSVAQDENVYVRFKFTNKPTKITLFFSLPSTYYHTEENINSRIHCFMMIIVDG